MKFLKQGSFFLAIALVIFLSGWSVTDNVEKSDCLESKKFQERYAQYEPSQDKVNFCSEKFNINII